MYMRSTNQTESMGYKDGKDMKLGGGWNTELWGKNRGEYDQNTVSA